MTALYLKDAYNGRSGEAPHVRTGGAPGHIGHAVSRPPQGRPGGHINKT